MDDLHAAMGKHFAKQMNDNLELAFMSNTNPSTTEPLNLDALKKALDLLPKPKDYMIHMDDALMIFRQCRKEGYRVERQKALDGKKNMLFKVSQRGGGSFNVYVDPFRTGERGRILEIAPVNWSFERPKLESFSNRDLGFGFRLNYGVAPKWDIMGDLMRSELERQGKDILQDLSDEL